MFGVCMCEKKNEQMDTLTPLQMLPLSGQKDGLAVKTVSELTPRGTCMSH